MVEMIGESVQDGEEPFEAVRGLLNKKYSQNWDAGKVRHIDPS
jgi:hypothetical protein